MSTTTETRTAPAKRAKRSRRYSTGDWVHLTDGRYASVRRVTGAHYAPFYTFSDGSSGDGGMIARPGSTD